MQPIQPNSSHATESAFSEQGKEPSYPTKHETADVAPKLPVSFISLPMMWKYRFVLLASVVATLGLALGYLRVAEKVYETEIRIAYEERDLTSNSMERTDPGKEFLATEAEVIHSPFLIQESLKLHPYADPEVADPVTVIMEGLRVSPAATGNIIIVAYQNSDPEETAIRLQAIFDACQTRLRQRDQEVMERTEQVLARQEKTLRADLAKLKAEYRQIRADSPWLGEVLDDRREAIVLDQLTSQLAEVQSKRLQLEQLMKSLQPDQTDLSESQSWSARLDENTQRTLTTLWQRWREAQVEFAKSRRIFGERHFQRQAAEERERLARQDYEQEIEQVVNRIQHDLRSAQVEESQLNAAYEKERLQQKERERSLIAAQQLLSEIAQVETAHQEVWASLNAARRTTQKLSDGEAPITAKLLGKPIPPQEPIWPQTFPVLAVSAFFSLLLGTAGIALIDKWSELRQPKAKASVAAVPHSAGDDVDGEHLARLEAELRQLQDMMAASQAPSTQAEEQPNS